MYYTPGQLRDAVGLSEQKFRYWKQALPGLQRGKCHGPIYSPGDVLAVAVLCRLSQSCGVRIGHLKAVSRCIFDVCNKTPWNELADRGLVVDFGKQTCSMVPKTGRAGFSENGAVVTYSMKPVVEMLQDDFLRSSPRNTRGNAPKASTRPEAKGQRR